MIDEEIQMVDVDLLAPNKIQSMRSKQGSSNHDDESVMPEDSKDVGSVFEKSIYNANKIMEFKVKNLAIQNLNKFRRKLKAPKNKKIEASMQAEEIINMLPVGLDDDCSEAFLYAYFCVRYYEPHVFRVIVSRANFRQATNASIVKLMTRDNAYDLIVNKGKIAVSNSLQNALNKGSDHEKLCKLAFEIALEKDYIDVAFHFIQNDLIRLTWSMVEKMLARKQEHLFKQCIKFGVRFDSQAAKDRTIKFQGRMVQ